MKIAIASPPLPSTIKEGLYWLDKLVAEAAEQAARIVCFPESFIPGYPLPNHPPVTERNQPALQAALDHAAATAAKYQMGIILPMDWFEGDSLLNVAFVIAPDGSVLGYQAKTQLDPTEEVIWKAGTAHRVFTIDELTFGITICHEGFRYPESVRWPARRGAQVVFHPHCTGSNVDEAEMLTEWGAISNPYYEKAMMMRSMENTIFFASANYAMRYPESASSLIAPNGTCLAHAPYGEPGVFVYDINLAEATGLLAKRYKPANFAEEAVI
ncbi:putative amidohydrolase [Chitinophaga skermanii]|uniref:Putative amidohydrolase n=1 Tax=Chitinophaga skermanii TaxID=331697 RepID=A0A327QZ59_9BACT|nr:carbon-nitrogen hydrolase family protein [Chitinophaga skermanii]RAJ08713.1 putative amidohydrolase [Chitinophaga skermanii]